MYQLDTSICIDFLRGEAPCFLELLRQTDPRLIQVSAIVKAELRDGAEKSRNPLMAFRRVEEFLLPFQIVPFDDSSAVTYGAIRAHLERQGTPIGGNDLLIAATALASGATLVARNVKEFKRVPGLMVEEWGEEGV